MPIDDTTLREYALPATPKAFLETFFPLGLVRDERGVVGVWCVFQDSLFSDSSVRRKSNGICVDSGSIGVAVRTKAGHPHGVGDILFALHGGAMESLPARAIAMAEKALDNTTLESRAISFPVVLRKAGIIAPYGSVPPRHVAFKRMLDHCYPCDDDANAKAVSSHLAKLDPFAATLDPEALAFANSLAFPVPRMGFDLLDDRMWNGIDATFTPTAPLRAAAREMPWHVDLLARQWRSRPWEAMADPTEIMGAAVADSTNDAVKAPASFAGRFVARSGQIAQACQRFAPLEHLDITLNHNRS
jgi:hypothetical protein